MKIFSGSANKPLAEKITAICGTSLSDVEIHIFPDGEKRVRITEPVVGIDTVIIQPTACPTDQNYMELFFLIDGLKRNGAKSITAVIPYMGYQRQDHVFREGEAVSLGVIIHMLETAGATKVIACDLHSVKIPELFKIPMIHLSALSLFAWQIEKEVLDTENAILVTPDMGGIRRIRILSELLNNMPFATIEKNRDLATGEVEANEIHLPMGVTLSGKSAVVVDDMISSGGTIVKAVALLRKKGVHAIFVFATHAVFSQNAPTLLQEADVEKVFVTDTVFVPESKQFPKLEILSVSQMIAEAL